MPKRVQVVLNEDILSLGKDGDLVDVAPGYARNFLLPFGKAVPVTPAVMKQVEHRRAKEVERQAALKQEALNFKTALDTIGRFTVKKQVGEDNVLFGNVTNGDVAEAIEESTKKEIDRRDILVPEIHRTGKYTVTVKLHSEVSAAINLEVVSSLFAANRCGSARVESLLAAPCRHRERPPVRQRRIAQRGTLGLRTRTPQPRAEF